MGFVDVDAMKLLGLPAAALPVGVRERPRSAQRLLGGKVMFKKSEWTTVFLDSFSESIETMLPWTRTIGA